MNDKLRIMGLDIAAVNSGLCIIEAEVQPEHPFVKVTPIYEEWLYAKKDSFPDRMRASSRISTHAIENYNVDFVVLEDYARRVGKTNTSAYEHAELCGLIKALLFASKVPVIIIPPTTMRSFMAIPSGLPDKGKQFIMDVAKIRYDFESKAPRKNQRSNITDAFIHSVIGSLVIFDKAGKIEGELGAAESKILRGDGKKIVPLGEREEIFFNFDFSKDMDYGEQEEIGE